jgi:hypothetical protein
VGAGTSTCAISCCMDGSPVRSACLMVGTLAAGDRGDV